MNPFDIVKDSSIWQTPYSASGASRKDPFMRIGIIKQVFIDEGTADFSYLVEIQNRNDSIEINARPLYRLGGVFNYEETVGRGYRIDSKPDETRDFTAKAGDTVLVAFLNGESREGVILGGLTHPARAASLDPSLGPQYRSEFNGIETSINADGEYVVMFKGQPTNLSILDDKPSEPLPPPEYDQEVGTSFFKLDMTGSLELSDNATSLTQNFRIDKAEGTITTNSGNISLKMTKSSEQVDLKCKALNVTSDDTIHETTSEYELDASTSVKIKSPKVAIGKDGIELLDQLSQLIDALSKVIPISPVGNCSPLGAVPQWSDVKAVQDKIKEITGGL
jgi:hypothetical protein